MQGILKNGGGASAAIRNMALGECRFMRAMVYYYLVVNWGAVPIVYDNIAKSMSSRCVTLSKMFGDSSSWT